MKEIVFAEISSLISMKFTEYLLTNNVFHVKYRIPVSLIFEKLGPPRRPLEIPKRVNLASLSNEVTDIEALQLYVPPVKKGNLPFECLNSTQKYLNDLQFKVLNMRPSKEIDKETL